MSAVGSCAVGPTCTPPARYFRSSPVEVSDECQHHSGERAMFAGEGRKETYEFTVITGSAKN